MFFLGYFHTCQLGRNPTETGEMQLIREEHSGFWLAAAHWSRLSCGWAYSELISINCNSCKIEIDLSIRSANCNVLLPTVISYAYNIVYYVISVRNNRRRQYKKWKFGYLKLKIYIIIYFQSIYPINLFIFICLVLSTVPTTTDSFFFAIFNS